MKNNWQKAVIGTALSKAQPTEDWVKDVCEQAMLPAQPEPKGSTPPSRRK